MPLPVNVQPGVTQQVNAPTGDPAADAITEIKAALVTLDPHSDAFHSLTVAIAAITALNGQLTTCRGQLQAANQQLAQVPRTADGKMQAPGTYVTMGAAGGMALGAGILGAIGGYVYRGYAAKGKSAHEAKEEPALVEATEKKRMR